LIPNFSCEPEITYYDFGAQHHIEILESLGLTMKVKHRALGLYYLERRVYFLEKKSNFQTKLSSHTKAHRSMKTLQDGLIRV
jgi:acyl-CoA thioester hydrolase